MTDSAITYHRPRRPGPELVLEKALISNRSGFLDSCKPWWLASSLRLGAGLPDLVAVRYDSTLQDAGPLARDAIEVLAYLRAVGQARLETVASRLQLSVASTEAGIASLLEAGAIAADGAPFSLTRRWRYVLPEVVAVEVKVSDWRRALIQATRNLVFAHRSFVALPTELAHRVRNSPDFTQLGIGIIGVGEDGIVAVARRARRSAPRSWRYYYELAGHVATERTAIAVSCFD